MLFIGFGEERRGLSQTERDSLLASFSGELDDTAQKARSLLSNWLDAKTSPVVDREFASVEDVRQVVLTVVRNNGQENPLLPPYYAYKPINPLSDRDTTVQESPETAHRRAYHSALLLSFNLRQSYCGEVKLDGVSRNLETALGHLKEKEATTDECREISDYLLYQAKHIEQDKSAGRITQEQSAVEIQAFRLQLANKIKAARNKLKQLAEGDEKNAIKRELQQLEKDLKQPSVALKRYKPGPVDAVEPASYNRSLLLYNKGVPQPKSDYFLLYRQAGRYFLQNPRTQELTPVQTGQPCKLLFVVMPGHPLPEVRVLDNPARDHSREVAHYQSVPNGAGHTSMSSAKPVLFAGELVINSDSLSWNNASYHYKPPAMALIQAVLPREGQSDASPLLNAESFFKHDWTINRKNNFRLP